MTPWKPSATVAALVERDGKFLLVEEIADGRRVLNQPAGHLDPGESLVAACARETLEETAHLFEPTALVGIYRWHYAPADNTFLRFAFAGVLKGYDTARKLDAEIVATHWLSREELAAKADMHRSPLVMRCIDDYLAGRRFPLDVFSREFA
ncbi:MAG: NUDIX hydrolase [Proteobacteria bacterium]|nr:NUDIX hydrolase [Pseudomonadota bacterium]